jgi:hypothetical protein
MILHYHRSNHIYDITYDIAYDSNVDIIVQIDDIIVHKIPMISYIWYVLWYHSLNYYIICYFIHMISYMILGRSGGNFFGQVVLVTVTRRASRDRIKSQTNFRIRRTETWVNAVVRWRGAGAPRGKGTIFHYGVKELDQSKIVFTLTVVVTAISSKIQLILQSIRFLTRKRLLQLCFVWWLPDLFLNNEPSIMSLNKELWKSILGCYLLPDYDFRDEFLVLQHARHPLPRAPWRAHTEFAFY